LLKSALWTTAGKFLSCPTIAEKLRLTISPTIDKSDSPSLRRIVDAKDTESCCYKSLTFATLFEENFKRMTKKEFRIVVDGVSIHYQTRGEGPDLVLLMGFGADGDVWEKHASAYEKHFRCIIPDNRGVGKSDQPDGPYSTKMMANDTLAVMDHANVGSAHIAGISMGGAIAQELVLAAPDRVNRLVLISTWPVFNNYAKTVYSNLIKLRKVATPADFMELLQLWIFAPPWYEDNMEDLSAGQQGAAVAENPQTQQGFEGQLRACMSHDTVDRLDLVKVPTLITIGSMDIFTPPAFSEILHHGIAGSQIVYFSEGGHVHHWEDLERFNQVTTDFLLAD